MNKLELTALMIVCTISRLSFCMEPSPFTVQEIKKSNIQAWRQIVEKKMEGKDELTQELLDLLKYLVAGFVPSLGKDWLFFKKTLPITDFVGVKPVLQPDWPKDPITYYQPAQKVRAKLTALLRAGR